MTLSVDSLRQMPSNKRSEHVKQAGESGNIELFQTLLKVEKSSRLRSSYDRVQAMRLECIGKAAENGRKNLVFTIIDSADSEEQKEGLRGIAHLCAQNKHPALAESLRTKQLDPIFYQKT